MEIRLKIENGPSKEEEKKVLDKLHEVYKSAPDSYLANLFSEEFISWCQIQIGNDFTCDAYEYIIQGIESSHMKTDLDEARERVQDLDQSNQGLEQEVKTINRALDKERSRVIDLMELNKSNRNDILKIDEIYVELLRTTSDLAEEKENLGLLVMKLKAEIYDLKKEGK